MLLIISELFYNMINAKDRTFKSMLHLCQYGVLKRMNEFDAKSVIPCFEAFSQLLLISQQIFGVSQNGNCQLLRPVFCQRGHRIL